MSSMTKTILAAVAVLGSVSFAQATSFDPNMANRYPSFAEPGYGYTAKGGAPVRFSTQSLQTRDVSLPRQTSPSPAGELWIDRASQSFSGGGY